jgi:peptidoglycan/LPS O-acetylase OafA/YrhL
VTEILSGGDRSTTGRGTSFRPDIEGLRAVAVILVVLDHVFGTPTGGFIGVDVFFVISGFLITGLLLREHERTGTISFAGFYARRAKRILPAAGVVLVVTVAASYVVYFGVRSTQVLWDGLASLLFVQNWHLIRSGTDYFAAGGASSPLQHFWSLSVEEQFYIIWPWVIIAVLAWAVRRGAAKRRAILVVVSLAIALSFGWSVWESYATPAWSYFSLESRAWELGVGALIAILGPRLKALRAGARPWMFLAGFAAILGSAFLITPATPFPGPWGAIPVAGTGLILIAGETASGRWMWPLTNPVSRYLGRISFSIYLWHYPVVILLTSLSPRSPLLVNLVALAATLLLSVLSYGLIEKPFRDLRFTRPRREPTRRSRVNPKALAAGGGILLLLLCAIQMKGPTWVIAGAVASASPVASPTSTPDAATLAAEVTRAARATSWPDLAPSLNTVTSADSAAQLYQGDDCLNDPVGLSSADLRADARKCSYGPASSTKTAVVLGDSIATSWLPAILGALLPKHWHVVAIGLESCPASSVDVTERLGRASFPASCDSARAAAISYAATLSPRLVIMSNALGSIDRFSDGTTGKAAETAWARGTLDSIRRLAAGGARVDVLESPPESTAPVDCATRLRSPATCLATPGNDWFAKRSAEKTAVLRADSAGIRAAFVTTSGWFCTVDDECPAFVGTTLVKVDTGHLTTAYSRELTGVMGRAILP